MSLLTVAIPVNYSSKFMEILEATSYHKKYTKCRGLGMPAHNNSCAPHQKGLGAHDIEFLEMKRLMIN